MTTTTKDPMAAFDPEIRFNWGYWDGVSGTRAAMLASGYAQRSDLESHAPYEAGYEAGTRDAASNNVSGTSSFAFADWRRGDR